MGQLKENSSTEGPSKVTPRVRSQPDKHNRSSMEGLKPVSLVVSLPSRRELSVVKQSRGDAESDGCIPSISVSGYTYVSECGARQSFNTTVRAIKWGSILEDYIDVKLGRVQQHAVMTPSFITDEQYIFLLFDLSLIHI